MFYSDIYANTTHSVRSDLQMLFFNSLVFCHTILLIFIKSVHYHGTKGTKMDILIIHHISMM